MLVCDSISWMNITKIQQKFLRSKAHHLKPVIWIGQNGLTESVTAELETALDHHELIKVKLRVGDRELINKMVGEVCEATHSVKIQGIGSIVSIFRRNEKQPVIALPR
jgi:RNA-binding protein